MELPTVQHYLHLLSVCLDPSPSRIYDRDARLDTLNGATRATLGGFKPVYAEHRLAWLPALQGLSPDIAQARCTLICA